MLNPFASTGGHAKLLALLERVHTLDLRWPSHRKKDKPLKTPLNLTPFEVSIKHLCGVVMYSWNVQTEQL